MTLLGAFVTACIVGCLGFASWVAVTEERDNPGAHDDWWDGSR